MVFEVFLKGMVKLSKVKHFLKRRTNLTPLNEFYIYQKQFVRLKVLYYLSESEKREGVPNWSDKEQTFSVLTSDWKYGFNIKNI